MTSRAQSVTARSLGAAAVTLLLLGTACSPDEAAPPPAASEQRDGAGTAAPQTAEPQTETDTPQSGEATTLDQVTEGETRLVLEQGFLDTLRTLGVDVEVVGPATRDGNSFTFPVSGGRATLDPGAEEPFSGSLQHEGGLVLSALGRSVEFTELQVDGQPAQVTALVSGQRVPLLALPEGQAEVSREAGQIVVDNKAASLRPEAVKELTGGLGLPALPQAQLGQLQTTLPE